MRKLISSLMCLFLLAGSAFAVNTTTLYSTRTGHYLRGSFTQTTAGVPQCISQINGEVYKTWAITITGTATVVIKASADNKTSFNTLATYTQGSTAPIGGEAQNDYSDFCIDVTVCSSCTVSATLSTGSARVNPMQD